MSEMNISELAEVAEVTEATEAEEVTEAEEIHDEIELEVLEEEDAEEVASDAADESYTEEASEELASEQGEEDMTPRLEALKGEIELLRRELEAKRSECERLIREFNEFSELFPARDAKSIPESVWDGVRGGIPLAAAYALYEKKREAQERERQQINAQNARSSTGAISSGGDSGYFSPSEVKRMSPAEVRKNYNLIIESMKKWN